MQIFLTLIKRRRQGEARKAHDYIQFLEREKRQDERGWNLPKGTELSCTELEMIP